MENGNVLKQVTLYGLASLSCEASNANTLKRSVAFETSGRVETRVRIAECDRLMAKNAREILCTIADERARSRCETSGTVLTWRADA